MAYIEGFVTPVPKKNLAQYKKFAKLTQKIWKEYGALESYEMIADDVPDGKITSFPKAVKLKKNEVVFFSWIVYKNKAERKRISKAVMNDPRLARTEVGLSA